MCVAMRASPTEKPSLNGCSVKASVVVVQVQADEFHQVEAHGALGGLGHAGVQKSAAGCWPRSPMACTSGTTVALSSIAKRIEALGGRPRSYWSSHTSYGSALGVHELGLMLKLGDDFIHIGLKTRPVVGRLGLVPHGVGLAGERSRASASAWETLASALVAAEHAVSSSSAGRLRVRLQSVSRANERTSSTDFSLVSSL